MARCISKSINRKSESTVSLNNHNLNQKNPDSGHNVRIREKRQEQKPENDESPHPFQFYEHTAKYV